METDIIYKTALLAKEKGFDWEVNYAYIIDLDKWCDEKNIDKNGGFYAKLASNKNCVTNINKFSNSQEGNENYLAKTTQSILQKWFREVHSIYVNVRTMYSFSNEKVYNFYEIVFIDINEPTNNYTLTGDSEELFETSFETGLYEALNKI